MKVTRLVLGFTIVGLASWVAYRLTPSARHQRHLSAATSLHTAQLHGPAEIEYLNALRLRPDDASALVGLGNLYLDQGRVVRAHFVFNQALKVEANSPAVQLGLARTALALGRPEDAVRSARLAWQAKPNDPIAPLILATAGIEREEIRNELHAAPSEPRARAAVLVAQGLLLAQERAPTAALECYSQALATAPACADAHLARAALLSQSGEIATAEGALAAAAALAPLRSAIQLHHLRFLCAQGRQEAALTQLADITRNAPDFVAAWVLRAEVAASQRQISDAIEYVGEALRRDPYLPEALLLLARLHETRGDLDAAALTLQAALRDFPTTAEFAFRLGLIESARGDLPKAETCLVQALTLAPGQPAATLALAGLHLRRNDTTAAAALLTPFLEQNPQSNAGRLLLVETHRRAGRWDAAIALSRQLESEAPDDPSLPILSGQLLALAGHTPEARERFARALALKPGFIPALEQLSALDLAAGRREDAEERVAAALRETPAMPGLYRLQARLRLAARDVAGAETALLHAIDLDPRDATAYTLLAKIYQQTGRLPGALALARVATAHSPRDPEALLVAAVVKDATGDPDGAREAYEQVLALDPRCLTALNNLACLQEAYYHNLDLALELAQRARQAAVNSPAIADTLGWILYQKGYYNRALGPALEAAAGLPGSGPTQYHLGLTRYMLGDEAGARAALERALGLQPADENADLARHRLTILGLDGRTAPAEAIAQLERDPNLGRDPIALRRLGDAHAASGQPAVAAGRYEQAMLITPPDGTAGLKLIELWRSAGDSPRALEVARNLHRALPDHAPITRLLASLALGSGDYSWAFGLLEDVTPKLPDTVDLRLDHALAAAGTGRLGPARESLQAALRLSPSAAEATQIQRQLQALDFANDAALAAREEAKLTALTEAEPKLVTAIFASGLAAEQRGQTAQAQSTYRRSLQLAPDFTPARKRLAILLANANEEDSNALALAIKARRESPQDAEVARALGILLVRAGQPQRALPLLREATDRVQPDARLLLHLGLAQRGSGRAEEARRSLEAALQLQPDPTIDAEIRRGLAQPD
jgi:tetratricopeptide (TPR) repeat protein